MFFHEIGSLLKNKREEMAISHEDVKNKLKIPLRSIIAIENGNLDELPHEVYVRTFLKGYASYLGFSTEEIRNVFNDIEDFKSEEDPPKSIEVQREKTQKEETKPKNVKFIAQLLLVALLGVSAYYLYAQNGHSGVFDSFLAFFESDESKNTDVNQIRKIENKNKNKNLLVDADKSKNQVNGTTNTEQKTSYTTALSSENSTVLSKKSLSDIAQNKNSGTIGSDVVNLDNTTESTISNFANVSSSTKNTENIETFIASTPEALIINWNILPVVTPGQQQAVIYVSQDCWMNVIVDGKATHFTLKKGSQRGFTFSNTLQLKLGNASAVTLFYNRKLIDVGDSTLLRTINLGTS